jgi:hypothetical protein
MDTRDVQMFNDMMRERAYSELDVSLGLEPCGWWGHNATRPIPCLGLGHCRPIAMTLR